MSEDMEPPVLGQDLLAGTVHMEALGTSARAAPEARARAGDALDPPHGLFLWVTDTTMYIIGTLLILVAVVCLYFFERRRARADCLLSVAQSSCQSLSASKAVPGFSGSLVHLTGEEAQTKTPVEDSRFDCSALGNNCIRLRSEVQVFQWIELARSGGSDPGGDSGYLQRWTEAEKSSARYRDKNKVNTKPDELRIGVTTANAARVEYGVYVLPSGLVDQLKSFRPASHLLGEKVTTLDGMHSFKKHSDDYFYYRPGPRPFTAEAVAEAPQIGDARARFEFVAPGPATVLALQAEAGVLLPFRLAPRGLCGASSDERAILVKEGRKTREQLSLENQCLPGGSLCCGCNVVAGCCAGAWTPEVFRCFEGTLTAEQCFMEASLTSTPSSLSLGTWTARTVGCTVLFIGLMMGYSQLVWHHPMKTLPVVELLGNFARPGCCMLATVSMLSLMICMGYLAYRPLTALVWFMVAAGIVLAPNCAVVVRPRAGASLADRSAMALLGSGQPMLLPRWLDVYRQLRGTRPQYY